MEKRKNALENLTRPTILALLFPLFYSSRLFAAESMSFSASDAGPSSRIAREEAPDQLFAEKVRQRSRALIKESFLRAAEERSLTLEAEAERALAGRDFFKARKRVRQILLQDPHHRRALELLGRIQKAERGQPSGELSFELFKEEVAFITEAEKKKMIVFFLNRGKSLLRKKRYDDAVDEIENVFVLDPLNADASRLIDKAKDSFVRATRKEWKKRAVQSGEDFSDKMELSFNTVARLIEAKEYMQARVILNRLAFMDPDNKKIRKLMNQIQQLEQKEAELQAA